MEKTNFASIAIHSNSKVYVMMPSKNATGGIELLHQLIYRLRTDLNIDAYLYWPYDPASYYVAQVYLKYKNPIVYSVEDAPSNFLIYPEAYGILPYVVKNKRIKKIMWWLSVDNFYVSMLVRTEPIYFFQGFVNAISKYLYKKPIYDIPMSIQQRIPQLTNSLRENRMVRQTDYHLCQSYYAHRFLTNAGVSDETIYYLSDYLDEDFLNIKTSESHKENIVAYNPAKGYMFTKQIIKSGSGITFVPLVNMSRKQVIDTLQSAKVYIDFGHHPGKDRIPREAAILGCCVITGKRGSAAIYQDVSIPCEYKYDDKEEYTLSIIHKIKDCLGNYQERYTDFEHYRRVIKEELSKFITDLKNIFVVEN